MRRSSRRLVARVLGAGGVRGRRARRQHATLNLWVFNEPSGSFNSAAKRCTEESNGRYKIVLNALSNDADQQRQSLVRRLAAKDASIDIMAWTSSGPRVRRGRLDPGRGPRRRRQGQARARSKDRWRPRPTRASSTRRRPTPTPSCSGTARTSCPTRPTTWDEMIDQAAKIEGGRQDRDPGRASTRASSVWFNSLVAVSRRDDRRRTTRSTLGSRRKKAAEIMQQAGDLERGRPVAERREGGPEPAGLRAGPCRLPGQLPVHLPERQGGAPEALQEASAGRRTRRVEEGKPAKAPIGGINWGVGGYTKHPEQAFEAATCLRSQENQRDAAIKGGLPPTLSSLYDDKKFEKTYPFAALIRKQLDNARRAPRDPAVRRRLARDRHVRLAAEEASTRTTSSSRPARPSLQDALDSKGLL